MEGGGSDRIPEDTKDKICEIAEDEFDECGYSAEETEGGIIKFQFTYHAGDEEETTNSLSCECDKPNKEKESESETEEESEEDPES